MGQHDKTISGDPMSGRSAASEMDLPSPAVSDEIMSYALDHYLKYHEVVMKKLCHAREATKHSLHEINALCKRLRIDGTSEELEDVKKYDEMWRDIIHLFSNCGASETELELIENVLVDVPETIRRHYEVLLQQDQMLAALIEEISNSKYRDALDAIKKIQSRPNPMSGMTPEEYDEVVELVSNDAQIFRHLPQKKKGKGKIS